MKIPLKHFQVDAVGKLRARFDSVSDAAKDTGDDETHAILLNAPTGSGKTMIATALIEELLEGSETDGTDGDPNLTFLWLTDQPELNEQTFSKMDDTSTVLGKHNMTVISNQFEAERLQPGHLYFLNTQKLGANSSLTRLGDDRHVTIWQTLRNSLEHDPSRFVLFLDEAHRGAQGKEAEEANTIMQRFVKGGSDISLVPMVIGISATPKHFLDLCTAAKRTPRTVDVPPAEVRASGLLKDYVDLYHPDEEQPNDVTMLNEAIATWQQFSEAWGGYEYSDGEDRVEPALLVQVRDATKSSKKLSTTDLDLIVSTLVGKVKHTPGDMSWLAHAFQDHTDHVIAGHTVRYVAPSDISDDTSIRVVLFKTSLNTGWDCPRAETMVSFRSARDETNIAQLVGRMVRAPLARHVDSVEHLNTVALFLPHFDRDTVEKVIERLADPNVTPPTDVRVVRSVELNRASDKDECFEVLAKLPSYVIPRPRPMKPVPRLAALAALLGEMGAEADPVKTYRAALVKSLLDELDRLKDDEGFRQRLDDDAVLDIRRRRHTIAGEDDEDAKELKRKARIADSNIDDLYNQAGRRLGEGLHKEYLRVRRQQDKSVDTFDVKLELNGLVSSAGVIELVAKTAEDLQKKWVDDHKAGMASADEKHRQLWKEIQASGGVPSLTTIDPPTSIEGNQSKTKWRDHLYVPAKGQYPADFTSSWEAKALTDELEREDVVGWLRNPSRKPWALCVPRKDGTGYRGIYPDFIIFRKTKGGLLADIIDPHLLNDADAPVRAQGLAQFAADHSDSFGRIELIIYDGPNDETGKRLDLVVEKVRAKVAGVTTHEHLRQLFYDSA